MCSRSFNFVLISILLLSCSSKKQIVYLEDLNNKQLHEKNIFKSSSTIQTGDILKIDITAIDYESVEPYNNPNQKIGIQLDYNTLLLTSYNVDENGEITLPILGKIKAQNLSFNELESVIKKILESGDHLINPKVSVKRLNSKFTVLGEVNKPGTYNYNDNSINILQAIGYAGDLTIYGKRKNIKLVRKNDLTNEIYSFNLNNSNFLSSEEFTIKNNDVIIVEPVFSKVKSAGFIGSPASISSIASILLSITLLIIN